MSRNTARRYKHNTNLGDIRRENNFIVTIADITDDGNSLDLIIVEAFLPKVSLNVIDLKRGNDTIKFAGSATWTGGTLTIDDVLSRNELDKLIEWFKLTYDPATGAIGYSSDYKKTGYVTEYFADGKEGRKWALNGLWISELDFGNLDASSDNLKQISATIQIDPSDQLLPEYTLDGKYDGESQVEPNQPQDE